MKQRRHRKEKQDREQPQRHSNSSANILHPIEPKTIGQELYLTEIKNKPITICNGVAGTGKSFLAFGSALHAYLSNDDIMRIVIVRPTFTAGDEPQLGFLPGTLDEKMLPFVSPLLKDTAPLLIKRMPRSASEERFIDRFGTGRDDAFSVLTKFDIEIVPIHMMRGRSFHNSFVILDEAQNCSMEDFKLFLTRIGKRSKVVIEGDATQKDRSNGALPELMQRLRGLDTVGIITLTEDDILRNPIIGDILKRLE